MRIIIRSQEFELFYAALPDAVQKKVDYALSVITQIKVVNTKLVKNLSGTDFYELRISSGNE